MNILHGDLEIVLMCTEKCLLKKVWLLHVLNFDNIKNIDSVDRFCKYLYLEENVFDYYLLNY